MNRIWTVVSSDKSYRRSVIKFASSADSAVAADDFIKQYPRHTLEALMPGEIKVITYHNYV